MQIEVKFSGASLDTFVAKVAALGADAPVEMARGLNDAGDIVRTQVRRALKDQMGVTSYGIVVDATGSIPASPSGLVYKITGTGKGLPIKDFPVSAAPGGPVTAMPWGVSHTFTRSFKTTRAGRLLARRGASRLPVRRCADRARRRSWSRTRAWRPSRPRCPRIVEPTIMRRLIRDAVMP